MGAITAAVFFAAGLVVGRFVLTPAPAPLAGAASTTDVEALAAAVRAEVRTALEEAQPTIIAQAQQQPQTQQQPQSQAQQQPQVVSNVSVDDDPALGPEDAQIVVVEFSDYQ